MGKLIKNTNIAKNKKYMAQIQKKCQLRTERVKQIDIPSSTF